MSKPKFIIGQRVRVLSDAKMNGHARRLQGQFLVIREVIEYQMSPMNSRWYYRFFGKNRDRWIWEGDLGIACRLNRGVNSEDRRSNSRDESQD